MKKFILLLIICLFIFTSCEKVNSGKIRYEINTESNYFHVEYVNEYGYDVTEVVQDANTWYKEIDGESGDGVHLIFDNGPPMWGNDSHELTTLSISFKGDIIQSYSGVTEYESIFLHIP